MSRLRVDRLLMGAAVLWLGALWFLPGWPPRFSFIMTLALVSANAIFSLWTLTHTRRILVGLNAVQLVLFGLLSFQLACAFGDGHYHFDREPRWHDWIEFTAAHVLRAADMLDALEEHGIHLQTISHRSTAAGLILIAMHLTVDVFLFDVFLRWLSRCWREPPIETRLERGRREFAWLLATLVLFLGIGVMLRLRPIDWLLWPIDQLLRLIDVSDIMNVFAWRLHGVEPGYSSSCAGLAFRIAAGIWMARLVILWRVTVLRGWGLSVEELTKLLDDPDSQVRRGACTGLAQTGPAAVSAVQALTETLHDLDRSVRLEAVRALGAIGPAAHDAAPRLLDAVWLSDRDMRLAAARALGDIGPAARSCVHSLLFFFKVGDDETRRVLLATLQRIAPLVLERMPIDFAAEKPKRIESRRKGAWLRCVQAAQQRQAIEDTVRSMLLALLHEGYFAEEREIAALIVALAGRGRSVTPELLVMPLLIMIAEGALARRRGQRGVWVYRSRAAV
jgi:hypothetical protein